MRVMVWALVLAGAAVMIIGRSVPVRARLPIGVSAALSIALFASALVAMTVSGVRLSGGESGALVAAVLLCRVAVGRRDRREPDPATDGARSGSVDRP